MLLLFLYMPRSWALDSDGDGLDNADEILAHLPVNVADSDGDGRVDYLDPDMDGDGIPNADECRIGGVTGLAMVNGSFEEPDLNIPYTVSYPNDGDVPGWRTTGGVFEFWGSGMEGKWAYDGDQFAELNAFSASTLYQDIPTTVGDVYIYTYSHRARFGGGDTMRFNLGPPSGPLATIRTSVTGSGAWGRYGGIVSISEPVTRFAFESVSSSCGGGCGNFLDAISFTPVCDLDTDNDGLTDALDTDSDDDGINDGLDLCPGYDDALGDPDGDGLCAVDDACPFDPWNDADFDGVCGDVDACAGFNDSDDMDNDDTPDGCDSDRDGDGLDESTDCNENDPTVLGPKQFYWDMDGDTYGKTPFSPMSCTPFMPGRVLVDGDCNDSLASVYPLAIEVADGLDQDCDGIIDEETSAYDDDEDGFSEIAGDCSDEDIYVFPGQVEVVNGLDDDCNLLVDDNTNVYDDDNDGYSEDEGDCNDGDILYFPTAAETPDLTDEDCDGIIDETTVLYDDDNDGYTEIDGDCDDSDVSIGLPQIFYEDLDGDGFGWSLSSTVACAEPPRFVEDSTDCDDADRHSYPGAPEQCDELFDRNCDGSFGSSDNDNDHWAACEECDDMNPTVNPVAAELCDGLDNNCDGLTDEGCPAEDTDIDTDTDLPSDTDTDVIPTDTGFIDDTDECFDPSSWELSGGWSCSHQPSRNAQLISAVFLAIAASRRKR